MGIASLSPMIEDVGGSVGGCSFSASGGSLNFQRSRSGGSSDDGLSTLDDMYDHQSSWYYEHKENGGWGTASAWRTELKEAQRDKWRNWARTHLPNKNNLHNGFNK